LTITYSFYDTEQRDVRAGLDVEFFGPHDGCLRYHHGEVHAVRVAPSFGGHLVGWWKWGIMWLILQTFVIYSKESSTSYCMRFNVNIIAII